MYTAVSGARMNDAFGARFDEMLYDIAIVVCVGINYIDSRQCIQLANIKNAVFGVFFEIFSGIDDFAVIHPADLTRVSRFKRWN